MAKFAANANPSASTKIPLIQVMHRYVPRMSFNPMDLLKESTHEKHANSKAWSITAEIKEVWEFVRNELTQSQKVQVKAVDRHRKDVEEKYKVGDKVWLLTKNIKTKKLLKKLNHKMIDPYKIKKLVRLSYQLKLSTSMKIHDVFHPSLLRKAAEDRLPGQHNNPALPVIVDDKEKREVIDRLDASKKGRKEGRKEGSRWKGSILCQVEEIQ